MPKTRRQQLENTYRLRVLAVVEASHGWMTGKQVADASGLTYKQSIDALNALLNAERVARTGRKFTARWGPLSLVTTHNAAAESFQLLTHCFRNFFK